MYKRYVFITVMVSLLLSLSQRSFGYSAGDIVVRIGAGVTKPKEDSDQVTLNGISAGADSGVSVDDDTQLGGTLTYFFLDKWGIEAVVGLPFTYQLSGEGAALASMGFGKVAEIEALPAMLLFQYFPLSDDLAWKPYIGLGLNYTLFRNEKASKQYEGVLGNTSASVDASAGLAFAVGVDYQFSDRWLVNAGVYYADIGTTAELRSPAAATTAKVDIDVDLWVYLFTVGYKF